MNILLDTHIFPWYLAGDFQLSMTHRNLVSDPQHRKFLSIASLWEIAIKTSTGKLTILHPLNQLVPAEIEILPLRLPHLTRLQIMPFYHRDPFDRVIIAQAFTEKMSLLSADNQFTAYGVTLL